MWDQIRERTDLIANVFTIVGVLGLGGLFAKGRKWWRDYWTTPWTGDPRDWDPDNDLFSEKTDPENAQLWSETRGKQAYYQALRVIFWVKRDEKRQRMNRIREAEERFRARVIKKKDDDK